MEGQAIRPLNLRESLQQKGDNEERIFPFFDKYKKEEFVRQLLTNSFLRIKIAS